MNLMQINYKKKDNIQNLQKINYFKNKRIMPKNYLMSLKE